MYLESTTWDADVTNSCFHCPEDAENVACTGSNLALHDFRPSKKWSQDSDEFRTGVAQNYPAAFLLSHLMTVLDAESM